MQIRNIFVMKSTPDIYKFKNNSSMTSGLLYLVAWFEVHTTDGKHLNWAANPSSSFNRFDD